MIVKPLRKAIWKPAMTAMEEKVSNHSLNVMKRKGILPSVEYDLSAFETARTKLRHAFNCSKGTSIRPEEERILYAIGSILKPKTVVCVGSYFGYASSWIVEATDARGKAYLIDPDPEVCKLAKDNFRRAGLDSRVKIVETDFFNVVDKLPAADLVWIDAAGPKNSENPEMKHKKIYGPIIKALDTRLKKGSVVIAHNVFPLSPKTGEFKPYLQKNYRFQCHALTGCGMYVAKK